MTGTGSARDGADEASKMAAVREARNRFNMIAPNPERGHPTRPTELAVKPGERVRGWVRLHPMPRDEGVLNDV